MAEVTSLFLGQDDNSAGTVAEALEHGKTALRWGLQTLRRPLPGNKVGSPASKADKSNKSNKVSRG
jgi:hypothetical protein